MGNVKKVPPKKDTRTDAQKMTDATGPRPGSRKAVRLRLMTNEELKHLEKKRN